MQTLPDSQGINSCRKKKIIACKLNFLTLEIEAIEQKKVCLFKCGRFFFTHQVALQVQTCIVLTSRWLYKLIRNR